MGSSKAMYVRIRVCYVHEVCSVYVRAWSLMYVRVFWFVELVQKEAKSNNSLVSLQAKT